MPTSYLVQNNRIQVSEMPTASSDLLGKVVQYVGESDGGNLVHGHFYTCTEVTVSGEPTTYSWVSTNVQDAYSLPIASASTLGGVKVGDNLSIDGNGALSGAAPYSLPPASASTLGGIKVGSNLNIDNEGVLSGNAPYSLPTASDTTLGGVKVGSNLTINNGVLSIAPETISQTVSTYCAANFSEWSGALDSTLESSVMAAPANKVGEIKSALSALGLSVVDGMVCQTYTE